MAIYGKLFVFNRFLMLSPVLGINFGCRNPLLNENSFDNKILK
jgi:hypothetical protein